MNQQVPVRDSRLIELTWQLPFSPHTDYASKPSSYLSHLLGHEGAGSVLSLLKAKGWANGLSAGQFSSASDFSIFGCQVYTMVEWFRHCSLLSPPASRCGYDFLHYFVSLIMLVITTSFISSFATFCPPYPVHRSTAPTTALRMRRTWCAWSTIIWRCCAKRGRRYCEKEQV